MSVITKERGGIRREQERKEERSPEEVFAELCRKLDKIDADNPPTEEFSEEEVMAEVKLARAERRSEMERKENLHIQLETLSQHIEEYQKSQGSPEPLSMEEIIAEIKLMRKERREAAKCGL